MAKCRKCFRGCHDVCVERTRREAEGRAAEQASERETADALALRLREDGAKLKAEGRRSADLRRAAAIALFGKPLSDLGWRWRELCPPACLGRFGLQDERKPGFCADECWLRAECAENAEKKGR